MISVISVNVVLLHTGKGVSISLPSQAIPWQYPLLGSGPEKITVSALKTPVLNQFSFSSLFPASPQLERISLVLVTITQPNGNLILLGAPGQAVKQHKGLGSGKEVQSSCMMTSPFCLVTFSFPACV